MAALVAHGGDANLVPLSPSIGERRALVFFAHAFEPGLLLLRHELTALLVCFVKVSFPHRPGRDLPTLLHDTLASVIPDRLGVAMTCLFHSWNRPIGGMHSRRSLKRLRRG
jgi:hypothetical protein